MSAVGNIRRNPFWPVIVRECFHQGYTQVVPEETKHSLAAIIHGFTGEGLPSTQKYIFPRTFKALESLRNFRSQFRNFLKQELPNRNFFPGPDHRTRRPGTSIAHIDHDAPKKKLATPKPLLAAFGSLSAAIYEGLACVPTIPEEIPTVPARPRRHDPDEPVSDSKVLALFLVDVRDLSTLIEAAEGTAKFRSSRPAPLRMLGAHRETPRSGASAAPAAPPPVPAAASPQIPAAPKRLRRRRGTGAASLSERIVQRINSDRMRQWRNGDLSDLSECSNSIGPTLSLLAGAGRIVRVSRGVYTAATMQ